MLIVVVILIIVAAVLGYGCYNLLRKNEKLETIVEYQRVYLSSLDSAIRMSDEKIKALDEKGFFKSDDEVGWFFKNLLYIQSVLNDFKVHEYEENKNNNINNADPGSGK